jgi:UDPglucose--hexose-1-phosphate uridylyltransferase
LTDYVSRPSLKRWNPLLGEWVVFAPVTGGRPWGGSVVKPVKIDLVEYDPECYLCPGVQRESGNINPEYQDTFVFDNDFPSLSSDNTIDNNSGYSVRDVPAKGVCRVVCFSPKHNSTLAVMENDRIVSVISCFRDQFEDLAGRSEIENVLLFENKGEIIGVSNPHPHGQVYATDFVPRIISVQYSHAKEHLEKSGGCLYCSILEEEINDGSRIVTQNSQCVAFVPYFARHTYEIHIYPRRHVSFITELCEDELKSFSELYHEILIRYDNLFQMPFPNITIFMNAPCAQTIDPGPFHFHVEFCPPLRSRDTMKYMAGFETGGGNVVNPSQPGESAVKLRNSATTHYTKDLKANNSKNNG